MEGHKAINNIDTLLNTLCVSRHAACIRAGINYSTVHRWNNGGECKPENLRKLRLSALAIAEDAGKTLSKSLQKELENGRDIIKPAMPSITERLAAVEERLAIVEQRA